MKKINFIFGVHNHQPIGNFDWIFEEAFQKAYKPFLEMVEMHPNIKVSYHNSGILFDWMEDFHPEFIRKIDRMTKSNQLELLTGGYYEPILPVIPDSDKIGQINLHRDYLKEKFNYEAEGLWPAERIWEQHIVKTISETKVKYIIIDDTHFKYAGFKEEELFKFFKTEEQGKYIFVFPINKTLRDKIPFRIVEETIDFLRNNATEDGKNIVVFADDGEKFGFWPETYHSVYEEGWMERFFTALENNSDWINMIHFSEAIQLFKSNGLVYLPNASYAEMMHWALPNPKSYCDYDDFEKILKNQNLFNTYNHFVRGGFWRNFMIKYPESNHMHKKMLRLSERAQNLQNKGKDTLNAQYKIWMGQCNCPYWHGVWGGLYLPNLRSPVYRNLIEAENELDKLSGKKYSSIEITDFDFDGNDEIILESKTFNLYFYPASGGALYELDFKPVNFNLLDILSRRQEGYHRKLFEKQDANIDKMDRVRYREEGLEKRLFYDWYRHGSLIDHFFGPDLTLEKLIMCQYPEQGDFVNLPYEYSVDKTKKRIILSRNGFVWHDAKQYPIKVEKTIDLNEEKNEIIASYRIKNMGDLKNIPIRFGAEFNFGLLAGNAPDRYYIFPGFEIESGALNSSGIIDHCKKVEIVDKWLGIKIELSVNKEASFIRFPIETVSLSEYGFEKVYQSSVIIPSWKIELENSFEVMFNLIINRI